MNIAKTLAESVLQQHHAAIETVLRRYADALEQDGIRVLGMHLHDFLKTTTRQKPGVIETRISIKKSLVRAAKAWEVVWTVTTKLDGNLWTTASNPTQPPSGGSALYGSPQDATENKIRQPPSLRLDWTRLCEACGAVLPEGLLARDCRCQSFPGHGAG